jgi:hypothetical protein
MIEQNAIEMFICLTGPHLALLPGPFATFRHERRCGSVEH